MSFGMRQKRAVVVVVAAVLALALLLSAGLATGLVVLGGDGEDDQPTAAPTRTAAPVEVDVDTADARTPPDESLAPFYDQQLAWEACPPGDYEDESAECATLTVPVDYAEADGDTIDLALLRVPTEGEAVGSLVVNPGGPGARGTSYAAAAGRILGRDLLANLDVVGFDPRGVGRSAPVDCLGDAQLDAFTEADPSPDDAAEAADYATAQEEFFAGCVERTGEVLGHVSTVEAARDMDVLRAALDDPRLVYLGASYGTDLGATYAELFPERVGRMVLDAGIDPQLDAVEEAVGQAGGFETALRSYVANCTETIPGCYLGEDLQGGLDEISGLLDRVQEEPLPTSNDRELSGGLAFYGLVFPLYSEDLWPLLDQALRAALDGDGTALGMLADLYLSREDGNYADNSAEAIYAVRCLDDPTSVPVEDIPDLVPAFEEASPTFGETFAWGMVGCQGVQVEAAEPRPEIDAAGAAPIMVVGTTRDPATPYEWSVALAEQLESGVLVTRDGDGHTGYGQGDACVDTAVEDYLLDGTAPEDDLRC